MRGGRPGRDDRIGYPQGFSTLEEHVARRGIWFVTGAVATAGALALSPDRYAWLRRRAGLEVEDSGYFEDGEEALTDAPGDEPMDTREARVSLRARLSDHAPASHPASETPEPAAAPTPRPERADHSAMRARIDEARERVHSAAREGGATPPGEITEPIG